jgi:hypothetical protein
VKVSFYEELESLFEKFPKYHMKVLLWDFNEKKTAKIFLNRQLRMKVYTKLVMILELD